MGRWMFDVLGVPVEKSEKEEDLPGVTKGCLLDLIGVPMIHSLDGS